MALVDPVQENPLKEEGDRRKIVHLEVGVGLVGKAGLYLPGLNFPLLMTRICLSRTSTGHLKSLQTQRIRQESSLDL
jgi:hypothetical protein